MHTRSYSRFLRCSTQLPYADSECVSSLITALSINAILYITHRNRMELFSIPFMLLAAAVTLYFPEHSNSGYTCREDSSSITLSIPESMELEKILVNFIEVHCSDAFLYWKLKARENSRVCEQYAVRSYRPNCEATLWGAQCTFTIDFGENLGLHNEDENKQHCVGILKWRVNEYSLRNFTVSISVTKAVSFSSFICDMYLGI